MMVGSLAIICPASSWRSHMTAGQDGLRNVSAKHSVDLQRPMHAAASLTSRIDHHHLLVPLQGPVSAQQVDFDYHRLLPRQSMKRQRPL